MKPIRVRILFWKIVGVIATLFFAGCLVGSLYSRAYLAALPFVLLTFLSVLLLVAYGPVVLYRDSIEMIAPLGTFGIRWDEVRKIRYGRSHMVFDGESKRLTVPLPVYWGGRERIAAREFLQRFIAESKLEPKRSMVADLIPSKNAKRA